MCGIAGYIGKNAIINTLMITLLQIDRGVQGTGVAYCENNKVRVIKQPIHPVKFVLSNIEKFPQYVDVAISHNRQPSIGKVCYANTHPFISCDKAFALIHNGSNNINNKVKIKIRKKHNVHGDTDSEIITHLLEDYVFEYGDFIYAFKQLMYDNVTGAIIVLTCNKTIYAVRLGYEPLFYYYGDKCIAIGSSKIAITNVVDVYNNNICLLYPYSILVAKKNSVEIITTEFTNQFNKMHTFNNLIFDVW